MSPGQGGSSLCLFKGSREACLSGPPWPSCNSDVAGSRVPQGPSRVLHQRSCCCSQHLILQQQSAHLPAFPPPPWMHFDGGRKFLMVWPYAVCLCVCTHTHTQGPPSHCNTQAHNTHTQLYAHTHIGPPHHTCTRIHTQLYTHTHTRPPHHTCSTQAHTRISRTSPPHMHTHTTVHTHHTCTHTRVLSSPSHSGALTRGVSPPPPPVLIFLDLTSSALVFTEAPSHTRALFCARLMFETSHLPSLQHPRETKDE